MRYLSVKDLKKHQHYKTRRPPWIKLYQDLLEDYAYARLQDASKAHLVAIWLLASRYDNRIPEDAEWISRAIHATETVDIEALVSAGFLEVCDDASTPLAARKQNRTTETEREAETEKKLVAAATPPKLRAVRPSGPAAPPPPPAAISESWVTRLVAIWEREVGRVAHGRLGADLKATIERHDEETVTRAMRRYITAKKEAGQTCGFSFFAGEVEIWIQRGSQRYEVIDGEMNDALERATRPVVRHA